MVDYSKNKMFLSCNLPFGNRLCTTDTVTSFRNRGRERDVMLRGMWIHSCNVKRPGQWIEKHSLNRHKDIIMT